MSQNNIPPSDPNAPQQPAPQPAPVPQPAPQTPAPVSDIPQPVRTMGMLCHLLALSGLIVPMGSIVGPLVIWLIKKQEHPFIDANGKESLNFQITMAIVYIISIPLMFVCIGIITAIAAAIIDLVFVIIASMKSNQGIAYRYPFAIRLIK
jgi:uncharacterized Tic20 family protein